MDTPVSVIIDGAHLLALGQQVWWVALRLGAMLMVAPMIGTYAVPMRIRVLLALTLSTALAPLFPAAPAAALDAATVLAVTRELAIGAALGFVFRLALEAAALGGEMIAQAMGLSFAQMIDPMRGVQSPVMGQWFTLVAGLCFFALDGHLALVQAVAESYRLLAPGATPASLAGLLDAVPAFAVTMFAAGVGLALPIVFAMLAVNLAFGVLARTAPALNPIAIGLPAALLLGLVLLTALLPHLLAPLRSLFETTATTAAHLLS